MGLSFINSDLRLSTADISVTGTSVGVCICVKNFPASGISLNISLLMPHTAVVIVGNVLLDLNTTIPRSTIFLSGDFYLAPLADCTVLINIYASFYIIPSSTVST